MAHGYSRIFTLEDLLKNENLSGKIPVIGERKRKTQSGGEVVFKRIDGVATIAFNASAKAAAPFYNPLKTARRKSTVYLYGNLVGDHDQAVDAVYREIIRNKSLMEMTVNTADILKAAYQYSEQQKKATGQAPKLYLNRRSMRVIESLSGASMSLFYNSIIENIFYSDEFAEIQQKYKLSDASAPFFRKQVGKSVRYMRTYEQRKRYWQEMVGEI